MVEEPQIPLSLRQLFNAVCDEIATGEQLRELEDILRNDERARRLYIDYCRLHMRLHFVARVNKMAARAVNSIVETSAIVAAEAPPVSTPTAPAAGSPPKSPVLGFLGGAIDYVNHSRMLMFWLMALLVSGWFTFQLGSLLLDRSHRGGAAVANHSDDPDSPDASHLPGGSFANSAHPRRSDSVASMTALLDCHWRVVPPAVPPASAPAPAVVGTGEDTVLYNGEPFHVGSELSAGQQLDLVRGLAEITFRSGARIVLNGPAHFVIGSPLGGKLQIGKLTARVPHDAHGFTVESPAGKVVDLGTEFGVAVAADRTMEVEVFVGEVAVDASSPSSPTPGSSSTTPSSPTKVSAGHAARVAAGKPVLSIPPRPNRFVIGLGPREDPHLARAAYVNWMRSLKPAVWFRMEGQPADRVLHDEMGSVPDAALQWEGPGNPFVEGRVGKGLWLRGDALRDYSIVPSYPQAEHDRLTVTAWVYADSFPRERFCAACNWINGDGRGQFFLGLRAIVGNRAALFGYITDRDGKVITIDEPDAYPFPLYEWQHIAMTTDGSTLRLYRQGREVVAVKHVGLQYPVRQQALAIGVRPNDGASAPAPYPSYWNGKLDEIAIFNDALCADDIRSLAAAPPQ